MRKEGSAVDSNIREENEKKKKYLRRYQEALKKQKTIEAEIEQLRMDRMFPPALQQGGMPRGTEGNDLSSYAAKLDELLDELGQQLEKKIALRQEISRKIEEMDNETESLLLRYRYIHGMTFEEIATKLGYTYRHTTRLHGDALRNFKMS